MPNTRDLTTADMPNSFLVYGAPGSGKTTFASTFPRPIYFADFDRGVVVLRGKDGIEYDFFDDTIKNGLVIKHAYSSFLKRLGELEASKDRPATFVIDSGTTFSESYLRWQVATDGKQEADLKVWAHLIEGIRATIRRCTSAFKYFVFICHDDLMQDEEVGRLVYRPLMPGRVLPKELPIYFGEMYRAMVEQKEGKMLYRIAIRPGRNYDAKSRMCSGDRFGPLEEPDFMKLLKKAEER